MSGPIRLAGGRHQADIPDRVEANIPHRMKATVVHAQSAAITSGVPSSAPIVSFATANATEDMPAATPNSANVHSTAALGAAGTCGSTGGASVHVDIRRSLVRPVPSRTTAPRLARNTMKGTPIRTLRHLQSSPKCGPVALFQAVTGLCPLCTV